MGINLRVWAATVVAMVGMLSLCAQAQAGTAEGRISTRTAVGDDNRLFAFLPPGGTPVVVDTFTGRTTKIKDSDGCFPTDIYAGRVLLACFVRWSDDGYVQYFSHRLASTRNGKSSELGSAEPAILGELGKYWAVGEYDTCGVSPHCTGDFFLNLRTLWARSYSATSGPSPNPRIIDQKRLKSKLDLPDFPITSESVVDWDHRNLVTDDGRNLTLWRPGKESARIGKAIGYCCEVPSFRPTDFGGGQFIWELRGNRYRSVDVSSLKSRTISLPRRSNVLPIRGGVIISHMVEGSTYREPTYSIQVKRFR